MSFDNTISIETEVSLSLFQKPMISKPLSLLIGENKRKIEDWYDEIIDFVCRSYHIELTFDEVIDYFEVNLKKYLSKEAIKKLSIGKDGYNIIKVLVGLINDQVITDNIVKKIFIETVAECIYTYLFLDDRVECLLYGFIEIKEQLEQNMQ